MSGSSKFIMTREMIADQVDPRPVDVWNWAVSKGLGSLTWRSREFVRFNLLPSAQASVRAEGIYFEGMYYLCSSEWKTRARNLGSWHITIAFEPRLVDYIFIREQGKCLDSCRLTDEFYKLFHGLDFREVREYYDQQKAFEQTNQTRKTQSKASLHAQQKKIFKDAEKENKESIESQETSSNTALIKAIRSSKEEVRRYERKLGVEDWYGDGSIMPRQSDQQQETSVEDGSETYIALKQENEMLDSLLDDFFDHES